MRTQGMGLGSKWYASIDGRPTQSGTGREFPSVNVHLHGQLARGQYD
jgi:hypothetical protein